jgi:hypothetical protein
MSLCSFEPVYFQDSGEVRSIPYVWVLAMSSFRIVKGQYHGELWTYLDMKYKNFWDK